MVPVKNESNGIIPQNSPYEYAELLRIGKKTERLNTLWMPCMCMCTKHEEKCHNTQFSGWILHAVRKHESFRYLKVEKLYNISWQIILELLYICIPVIMNQKPMYT